MKPAKNPADLRPFQSKADQKNQQPLEHHYRRLAIPELVAAVAQLSRKTERPAIER